MPAENGVTRGASLIENGVAADDTPATTASTATPAASATIATIATGVAAPKVTAAAGAAKKEPVVTPAPLPTKSPWKYVATDIPVSNISVESIETTKKSKPKISSVGSVKSSSSTKWVPMKASIVVSGSKRAGAGKKNSAKGNQPQVPGGNKANNVAGKKKKQLQPGQQTPKKQQPQQPQQPKQVQAAYNNTSDTSGNPGEEEMADREKVAKSKSQATSSDEEEVKTTSMIPEGSQQSGEHFKHADGEQQPYRKQHSYNNQHHPRQQGGGFQRRRYYNNFNHSHNNYINEAYKNPQGLQHHHQKGPYPPYNGGMSRPFNHHYRPRFPGRTHQQQAAPPMYQEQFHPIQAIMVAVNSVARQIEYYFSSENLQRDEYLRSKFSKEGYAPAAMIAKFYRVNNMSFGGDPYLIMASLREIVANEHSTVDVATGSLVKSNLESNAQDDESPLSNYFVRSKNWSNWLPEQVTTEVVVEKILEGDELEEYLIAPAPVPPVYGPGPGSGPASLPAPVPVPVPVPVSVPAPATTEEEYHDETDN